MYTPFSRRAPRAVLLLTSEAIALLAVDSQTDDPEDAEHGAGHQHGRCQVQTDHGFLFSSSRPDRGDGLGADYVLLLKAILPEG